MTTPSIGAVTLTGVLDDEHREVTEAGTPYVTTVLHTRTRQVPVRTSEDLWWDTLFAQVLTGRVALTGCYSGGELYAATSTGVSL